MYSVVLLMALSGGAEAPDCHKHSCSGACTGGYVVATCHGYADGCTGSCHGGRKLFGGRACHGGGLFAGHRNACHGCSGYTGCCGTVIVAPACCGGIVVPVKPGEKLDMPKEKKGKEDEVSAPATIVLSVPADAQVSIDGVLTTSTSATRTFVTPELDPAKAFVYTLSAQIVRGGQTLTVSEKVSVQAGEETRINFGTEQFTTLTVAGK